MSIKFAAQGAGLPAMALRQHQGLRRTKSRYFASICTAIFLWTLFSSFQRTSRSIEGPAHALVRPTGAVVTVTPPVLNGVDGKGEGASRRQARDAGKPPSRPQPRKFYDYGTYFHDMDVSCPVPWVSSSM